MVVAYAHARTGVKFDAGGAENGHLYIKCIILPRQARDKHRESTQKKCRFPSGGNDDMNLWAEAINATGRVMMLENCNDGGDVPYKGDEGCPFNMFRTVRKRPSLSTFYIQ
jgi:hypothetical protein